MHSKRLPGLPAGGVPAFFLTCASALLLASCYPGTVEDVAEFDTVTTLFDRAEDFKANRTYSMPDTVIHLCDYLEEDAKCLDVSRAFDAAILSELASQMESRGYARVAFDPDDLDAADLVLVPSAIAVQNYAAWIDYWPCYYPYYCYYPPTWVTVEYEVGTLTLTLFAPDRESQDRPAIVWAAGVRGVLSGSSSNRDRTLKGIRQAFGQSPYLDVTREDN